MLVACTLVNLTTWEVAERAFHQLREAYRVPEQLKVARLRSLQQILKPLGLWRIRAKRLKKMAEAWLTQAPQTASDVLSFPGCGKYASDSWAIFIDRRTDVYPSDGKLNWYMERLHAGQIPRTRGAVQPRASRDGHPRKAEAS